MICTRGHSIGSFDVLGFLVMTVYAELVQPSGGETMRRESKSTREDILVSVRATGIG